MNKLFDTAGSTPLTTSQNKSLLKDALGWGFGLWLFGYILGFIFFAFVPAEAIGWYIMPLGIVATLWVLFKKVQSGPYGRYAVLAVAWTVIAVVFDYLFLVLLLHPADGYYKLDVYIYYALTFALPVAVGWGKSRV